MILIVKPHSGLSRIATFFKLIAGIACLSVLTGCGQQGPLYMPGQPMDSHGKPKKANAANAGKSAPNVEPAGDTGYVPPVPQ